MLSIAAEKFHFGSIKSSEVLFHAAFKFFEIASTVEINQMASL